MPVSKAIDFINLFIKNQNKVLFSVLAIETLLYLTLGHILIESGYKAESLTIVNNLFKGRADNTLDFYLKRGDLFYCITNILLYSFIYTISFLSRIYSHREEFLSSWSNSKTNNWLSTIKSKYFLSSLVLFFIFCILYLYLGFLLINQHSKLDFFGGDIWKASRYWTTFSAPEPTYFKGSHPLFLLLVCPWGSLLNSLTKSPEVTVVILNSLFGAFAVFLSSIFFNKLTNKYTQALILATVFGLSMSQLIFSSVPETYVLAGCSIITTYILFISCIHNEKLYIGYWILAGLFTFGITITDFIQTLICFIVFVFFFRRNQKPFTLIFEYIGTVVTFAFVLSLFQKMIITHSHYFFLPDMLNTETKYIKLFILTQPLMVIQELLKHFFLVNFVSSSPFDIRHKVQNSPIELTFFRRHLDYSLVGAVAAITWIFLLIWGAYQNILSFKKNVLIVGICINLLFNMVFYAIFGVNEMFLYTCTFTFLVLALAANKSLLNKVYFQSGLIALIILMLINNLKIMKGIAAL